MSETTGSMNSSYMTDLRKLKSARLHSLNGCVPAARWLKPSPAQVARMKEIMSEYNRLENQLAKIHNLPLEYPEEPEA